MEEKKIASRKQERGWQQLKSTKDDARGVDCRQADRLRRRKNKPGLTKANKEQKRKTKKKRATERERTKKLVKIQNDQINAGGQRREVESCENRYPRDRMISREADKPGRQKEVREEGVKKGCEKKKKVNEEKRVKMRDARLKGAEVGRQKRISFLGKGWGDSKGRKKKTDVRTVSPLFLFVLCSLSSFLRDIYERERDTFQYNRSTHKMAFRR